MEGEIKSFLDNCEGVLAVLDNEVGRAMGKNLKPEDISSSASSPDLISDTNQQCRLSFVRKGLLGGYQFVVECETNVDDHAEGTNLKYLGSPCSMRDSNAKKSRPRRDGFRNSGPIRT